MQTRSLKKSLDEHNNDKSDPKIGARLRPQRVFKRSNKVEATIPRRALERSTVQPSEVTAKMLVGSTAGCYNMNHRKRGTCVVFNHEIFDPMFPQRIGSKVDVERIITTFSVLQFDVIVHYDLSYSNVMDRIEKLSKKDHSDCDCLCIFVLTHGMANNYIMARDAAYASAKIWKPFTAEKCPTLAGKPKLFFFEASRGDKLDDGVMLVPHLHSCDDPKPKKVQKLDSAIRSIPLSFDIQPSISSSSYKIPTDSDFLIAHSCTEGFSSWRSPMEGTWYIQSLCKVLDQFWKSTDLSKMLTITARKVAIDFHSHHCENPALDGKKQVPSVFSTLTRDLYFTPKIVP